MKESDERKEPDMAEISIKEINELARLSPEEMIAEAERDYEKKVRQVADRVCEDENISLVLLAGPSGSGKTTTANLVADEIRRRGEEALVMSLDDFYRDQDDPDYPRLENGERDYERPEALNLENLHEALSHIVSGKSFDMPKYDFKLGRRVSTKTHPPIGHGCVIIEGLHSLNPRISDSLPKEKLLKLFVSVSTNINHEGERILSGRKLRFIRRLVRDYIYRGATLERTLAMWSGVLAAEDIFLYPYKYTADLAFNTFHTFEPGVMKKFVIELIPEALAERDPYLGTVLRAIKMAVPIDYHKIPNTSLIREFIPGGIYENLY